MEGYLSIMTSLFAVFPSSRSAVHTFRGRLILFLELLLTHCFCFIRIIVVVGRELPTLKEKVDAREHKTSFSLFGTNSTIFADRHVHSHARNVASRKSARRWNTQKHSTVLTVSGSHGSNAVMSFVRVVRGGAAYPTRPFTINPIAYPELWLKRQWKRTAGVETRTEKRENALLPGAAERPTEPSERPAI